MQITLFRKFYFAFHLFVVRMRSNIILISFIKLFKLPCMKLSLKLEVMRLTQKFVEITMHLLTTIFCLHRFVTLPLIELKKRNNEECTRSSCIHCWIIFVIFTHCSFTPLLLATNVSYFLKQICSIAFFSFELTG